MNFFFQDIFFELFFGVYTTQEIKCQYNILDIDNVHFFLKKDCL